MRQEDYDRMFPHRAPDDSFAGCAEGFIRMVLSWVPIAIALVLIVVAIKSCGR